MRKVLKYPNYKESDVEWLGSIPEHWKIVKAKRILREVSIKNHPDEPLLAATQTKGVIPKSLYENTTVTASKNFETLKLVRKGDFVISLRSFQGGIEYAHYQGIISPAYTILEPQEEVIHNYYRYLLKSKRYISGLTLLVTGIREGQNIDTSKFKDSFLPLPPKEEQTAIARFLDYKLAKINRFIQKKKQLIKLLNEQKAAIINQAVTKGLDPNAKMKDSGIEWLGEIPEHWNTIKLSAVCGFVRGNSSFQKDELLSEGKYVALQYGKTYKVDEVDEKYQFYVKDEFYKDSQVVKYGDVIIISTSETVEDLGHSVFYNRLDIGLLGGEQILLRPMEEIVNGKYLCYSSKVFAKELRKYATGVKVYRFNIDDLKTIYTSVPPFKEQVEIVDYIETESQKINTTISKIEKELALTEEYKTALIAEAVTGKIDVRGYEVPEIKEEETYEEIEEEISMAAEDAEEYQTIEE
ncbi:MAG: restriction endonuclease subunit S [Bacteroidales bacterium]|nr:restriction endonuclease subunit S [Bacteroidales bacterium]